MEQVDSETFNVSAGETITLTVVAHKVDEDVVVSFAGSGVDPDSGDPSTFTFKIAKKPQSQFADIECHFSSSDDDTSFYQFFVQGSEGGGQFTSSSIRKADNDWDTNLQFTIA
jgi:hypothetical protein